ncbi:MAG: Bax inhibitor-1/YccA family protein [Propioniciclava sp.]
MRSTNPVFTRSGQFQQQAPQGYANPQGYGAPQYGAPQAPQYGAPGGAPSAPRGVMTLDDVITKTAITLGALFLVAAATFMLLPSSLLIPTAIVSSLVGFVTVLLVSARRRINPGMVLVYSALQGVFIGAFSKLFNLMFPGIVVQAVFATFVAAGVTLFAYRFFNIKVTARFRRIVTYSTMAFAALLLVNLVLAIFGIDMGIRGAGGGVSLLVILVSMVAIVLAVANLVMDFDFVEQGVRNGLPASESWRAAFGLTVTMVWLYTEILRVLSYFRN